MARPFNKTATVVVPDLHERDGLVVAAATNVQSNRVMLEVVVGVFIVVEHATLRSGLTRNLRLEAERRTVRARITAVEDVALTLGQFDGELPNVVVVDESAQCNSQGGFDILEAMRFRGFVGGAFVLCAAGDYSVDAKSERLGARWVPKENLDEKDFALRVLNAGMQSAVKPISDADVAAHLSRAPDGLPSAMSRTRVNVVKATLAACNGNRSAAGRRLRMTRQQIRAIVDEDED